jgi:hypothetical protein
MAEADISAQEPLSKKSVLAIAPSAFEQTATALGYDIAPAVSPDKLRVYADRVTQDAFDMWSAGAAYVARMVTESTLETEALREKLLAIALSE